MDNDNDHLWQQRRLGFLVFSGREGPIITERLRAVPFARWLDADKDEEFAAQAELDRQLALRYAQRANEWEWLTAVTRPLVESHPGANWDDIFALLTESDAAKARAILLHNVPVEEIPLARSHRLPWHERVEGILALRYRDRASLEDDTLDGILREASIEQNSIEYPDALIHARNIAETLRSHPAGVDVPLMTQRQSDRPQ